MEFEQTGRYGVYIKDGRAYLVFSDNFDGWKNRVWEIVAVSGMFGFFGECSNIF